MMPFLPHFVFLQTIILMILDRTFLLLCAAGSLCLPCTLGTSHRSEILLSLGHLITSLYEFTFQLVRSCSCLHNNFFLFLRKVRMICNLSSAYLLFLLGMEHILLWQDNHFQQKNHEKLTILLHNLLWDNYIALAVEQTAMADLLIVQILILVLIR